MDFIKNVSYEKFAGIKRKNSTGFWFIVLILAILFYLYKRGYLLWVWLRLI